VIGGVLYAIYGLYAYECASRIRDYVSDEGPIGGMLTSGKTWERDKWQHCFANCLVTAICGGPVGLLAIPATELGGHFDWGDVKANEDGWACGTGLACRLGIAPEQTVLNECDACCVHKGYLRLFTPGGAPGFPPIPPPPNLPPYGGTDPRNLPDLPPPGHEQIGQCYRDRRTGLQICV